MKIQSKDKIGDILNRYPDTLDVLTSTGFNSDSKESLIESLGKDTMLKTVLKVRDISEDLFMEMINDKVSGSSVMEELDCNFHNPDLPLNFLVKTACPIGARLKERIFGVLRDHKVKTGKDTNCYIVGGCDAPHDYDDFGGKNSIDDIPDVIMSMSFDEVYDKRFIDKFVKTGEFENVLLDVKEEHRLSGIIDENYTMNAGLVMGLLIDDKKLGDLPQPKKWEDLLDPIYKDKIVGFGSETEGIFEYPLYYLYKLFGMDGIKKLASNIKTIYHAAKMSKLAGTNSSETGAINIIPLTFSSLCDNKDTTVIVPEDGGLLIPITFLVKKNKRQELSHLVEFLLNEYGQMCADIYGISFNTKVKNKIDDDTKLKWLGWDFIYSNDMLNLGAELKREFHDVYDNKVKGE